MVNIYCLVNIETNTVFYVGATKNSLSVRLSSHLTREKLPTIVALSKKGGLIPEIKLLETVELDSQIERETFWIKHFSQRGVSLENTHMKAGKLIRSNGRMKLPDSEKKESIFLYVRKDVIERNGGKDVVKSKIESFLQTI